MGSVNPLVDAFLLTSLDYVIGSTKVISIFAPFLEDVYTGNVSIPTCPSYAAAHRRTVYIIIILQQSCATFGLYTVYCLIDSLFKTLWRLYRITCTLTFLNS